ncbi:MAG: CPBP family intramembrane glutamic endopeptidase [Gemmatimonadaceae bacterium]
MRREIFFTADGGLRAVWRGALFLAVCVIALFAASVAGASLHSAAAMFGMRIVVHPLVYPLGFLAAHYFVLRKVDRREWSYVWLGREAANPPRLALGFALGLLAVGVPAGFLLVANQLGIADAPDGGWWSTAALSAAVLLPSAFAEELFARGYIFALVREAVGSKVALAATSIGFGVLHVANPGANWQSLSVVVLAGFFLGAVVLVTGSLYAATLAHFAWNWFIAAVLHMPVSGIPVAGSPDYRVVETGPDWLTGGSWGPEGGFAAGVGLSIGLVYLSWIGLRRSRG